MLSSPTAATGHLLVLTVRRSPYPIRLLGNGTSRRADHSTEITRRAEYPHWLMVAGAVLVVVGFVALGFSLNRNLEQTQDNVHPAPPPNSSVAGEEMSARHLSAGLWKPADDDQLRDMAAFGRSSSEIGRLLHRSPSAVRKRASLLGIKVQG